MKSWSVALSFALSISLACTACATPTPETNDGSRSIPTSERPVYGGSVPIAALSPREAKLIEILQATNNGYEDVQRAVTISGWHPMACDQCRENVVGSDYQKVCARNPNGAACRICDLLPELNSCSADGYCLMQFKSKKSKLILKISTYGDYGDVSNLMVTGWGFDTKASD